MSKLTNIITMYINSNKPYLNAELRNIEADITNRQIVLNVVVMKR